MSREGSSGAASSHGSRKRNWDWDWQRQESGEPDGWTPGRARTMGSLQAASLLIVAALLYRYWSQTAAAIVATLSLVILISALTSPGGLYAALLGLFRVLGTATGTVVGWILLVPVFYLFFAPFGCLFRRGAKDRLQRCTDAGATTYWEPHEGLRAASASRARQF